MNKSLFRLPEDMPPQARNGFLIAAAITAAHVVAASYYVYLGLTTGTFQFTALAIVSLVLGLLFVVGAALSWRGQSAVGTILVLVLLAVSYPPISAFLVNGLGLVLGIALLLVGPMSAFQVLPKRSAWAMTIVTVASGLATLLLDVFGSVARPSLPGVFIQLLATSVVVSVALLVVRQFRSYSMGTKLVVSFVAVAVLAIGIVSFVTYRVTSAQVTERVGQNLTAKAEGAALEITSNLDNGIYTMQILTLNKLLQDTLQAASATGTSSQAEFERLDQQWSNASDSTPLIQGVLNNELAGELREFQGRFPEYAEVFVTDKYGAIVASTDRTSDYYQADEEWWQTAWNNGQGGIYIGQPEFDESSNTISINMAMAVVSHNGTQPVGVLRVTVKLNAFVKEVSTVTVGQTGHAELIFKDQQYGGELGLIPTDAEDMAEATALLGTYGEATYEGVPSLLAVMPVEAHISQHQNAIDQLGWTVIMHQSISEAQQPITTTTRSILLTSFVIILVVAVAALGMAQFLSRPIVRLTAVAEQIAAGDIDAQAAVEFGDETGTLAQAFNTMTRRLREILGSLEHRVADRTRNLELAAEVGRAVSQVRALDVMLKDACELILKEFNLYYVQVYLADPSGSTLKLEAGTGDVGAQLVGGGHSLPLNTGSINGRAAVDQRSVVISDTTQSVTFRKNPLLPDTRGEMAVPLMIAGKVVGVLDMQSSQPGVLTDEVLPAFEALAGQLAVAVQNANLLAEAEQARAQVEAQARRLVRAGWNEHLDAIHKPEQLGFVFDHDMVAPLAETDQSQRFEDGKAISAPIAVTGEALGSLVVEFADEARREQINELVSVVARQVAQQIENLRLLESAERYRYEAEKAARLQTLEGWRKYVNSRSTEELGYLYDLKEVRPSSNGHDDPKTLTVPVRARDEQVGKLAIQGLTPEDREEVELANLVAERLGAHLESLRLTEQTQKRAYELEAVAAVSTTASSTLDPAQLLQSVVNLTKERFGLYHAHVYLLNDAGDTLDLAAGAGEVGKQMVAEGWKIPVDHPESIVARVARQRQSAIANNIVRDAESQFLSNRLLPNTRSEMAVPLIVGDKVLGVFDVQADTAGRFTEDDVRIQTTLAAQVAVAVQNARSFARAQKQAEREAMLNVINQKIQSATSVEAVLQIAARELGHALGAPMTVAQLSMKDKS